MSVESASIEGKTTKRRSSPGVATPPPYLPEQKVLCRDDNNDKHFYEAIIRKVKCISDGEEWQFFIHYQGWNSRWDRWVDTGDIFPDTPENRAMYLDPTKEDLQQAAAALAASQPAPSKKRKKDDGGFTTGGSGRKRKGVGANSVQKQYQEFCELPFTLKTILVDEYDQITRKGYVSQYFYDIEPSPRPARNVHDLPASVSVQQVLSHYHKKRGGTNQDKVTQQQVRKFCDGLALLFNDALPVCLLYHEERPQYEALTQDETFQNKTPAEIYGCEFLLRLYMRLPIILQAEPKEEMETLGPLLADLVVLLQKNRQACFKSVYREPKYAELMDWEKDIADGKKMSSSSNSRAAEAADNSNESVSQMMES